MPAQMPEGKCPWARIAACENLPRTLKVSGDDDNDESGIMSLFAVTPIFGSIVKLAAEKQKIIMSSQFCNKI